MNETAGPRGPSVVEAAHAAKQAARMIATLTTETKDAVLSDLAAAIEAESATVLEANAADMAAAQQAGLPEAKLKRLELTEAGLRQLCEGVRHVAGLPDPVNRMTRNYDVPSGLHVTKVRASLGVIAMIYEARPGVTIDAFALCFKAGNACVLKGGKEAARSNAALAGIAQRVLDRHGIPAGAISAVTTSDREEIKRLLSLEGVVDLVIPRGGEGLIRFVHEHAKVPTVQHFHGVCHCYVDAAADLEKALEIVATGKTSAPATCNALECVLVHQSVATSFAPRLAQRCKRDGVELRGDIAFREAAGSDAGVSEAGDDDWGREYLDLILAAKVVDSLGDAASHIARYGSNHTDSIVTEDEHAAERFCREVQSSCVLVNASTRFNDGFQLGLGAEIGISTSKIHAYGPMGLEELTCERYVVLGSGQTR